VRLRQRPDTKKRPTTLSAGSLRPVLSAIGATCAFSQRPLSHAYRPFTRLISNVSSGSRAVIGGRYEERLRRWTPDLRASQSKGRNPALCRHCDIDLKRSYTRMMTTACGASEPTPFRFAFRLRG
jgi:hypothetical protein